MGEKGKLFTTKCQLINVKEAIKLKKKISPFGNHHSNNLFGPESSIDAKKKLDKHLGKTRIST